MGKDGEHEGDGPPVMGRSEGYKSKDIGPVMFRKHANEISQPAKTSAACCTLYLVCRWPFSGAGCCERKWYEGEGCGHRDLHWHGGARVYRR